MSKHPGFHFARVSKSPALQAILAYLQTNATRWVSTLDITLATKALNVASYISQLRANGYAVDCHYQRTTETKSKIYVYRLRPAEYKSKDPAYPTDEDLDQISEQMEDRNVGHA